MRFIREHFSIITRLFVYQIGLTFFGIVLSFAVAGVKNGADMLLLAVSVFSILFYLALIYNVMWEQGAKDVIRIEAGRMPDVRGHAARLALAASIPNFAIAFLLVVGFVFGILLNLSFMRGVYGVLYLIAGLFEGMYIGLFGFLTGLVEENEILHYGLGTLLYVLSSLPMVGVSALSYYLGKRNVRLFSARPAKK